MNVSFKVGSVIHVPSIPGLSVVSSDPSTISLTKSATGYTATALKVGQVILMIQAGTDVMASWMVSVVAA
jgi:hypothetical protein